MTLSSAEKKLIKDELLRIQRGVHKTLMDSGMTRQEAAKAIRWTGHVLEHEVDYDVLAATGERSNGDTSSGDQERREAVG